MHTIRQGSAWKRHLGSRPLTDDELLKHIHDPTGLPVGEARRRLAAAKRFVDLDNTLYDHENERLRSTFCGRPLAAFLGESPWVLQSWNPEGAVTFVLLNRHLPPPLLVVEPPGLRVPKSSLGDLYSGLRFIEAPDGLAEDDEWVFKDLFALGATDVEVYDDFGPGGIHAPGCRVISQFD